MTIKSRTWSHGTNSRLPFRVNINLGYLNLSNAFKSSRKQPLSLLHINQDFNETAHCTNGSLIKMGLFRSKTCRRVYMYQI